MTRKEERKEEVVKVSGKKCWSGMGEEKKQKKNI